MSKKKLAVILSIVIGVLLSVTVLLSASAYTNDDPLITLSYLNEIVIPSLKNELGTSSSSEGASNTYQLIELSKGQTVMANSICEFIARPGSYVSVISPHENQGIADITNGTELYNGSQVPMNAYCLIPRGKDGRGFRVDSQKAYIMIRGDYTIG